MKRIFSIVLCALTCALMCTVTPALARDKRRAADYSLTIVREHAAVQAHRVAVDFTLDVGAKEIRSNHKRVITPVVEAHDGSREIALSPLVYVGRKRAMKELRDNLPALEAYTPRPVEGETGNHVNYRALLDYEPWMEDARLILREEVIGCACGGLLDREHSLRPDLLYKPRIELTPEEACPVAFVPRKEERDAYLIYPVNQTVLYPDLYGNRAELLKIDSALTFVRRNPAYEIQRVEVAGFASPEGSLAHNVFLSEGRAAALKNYIVREYGLSESMMTVKSGAENWDGLIEALQTYQMPYRDEVLRTIASVSDLDAREEAIRRIDGGRPYATLLKVLYPSLRKNTFTISYISKERTLDEAHRLVFDRPEELNVYEFYNVAAHFYADDRATYERVLLIAADTYPRHLIAAYNAARICMLRGEYDKAEAYMLRAADEPLMWNNRACLFWMQGNRSEAMFWWRKAEAEGNETAARNLREVAKREQ